MSFSSDAKNEIIKLTAQKKCCKEAYARAFFIDCETDGGERFLYTNKNESLALAAQKAINAAFGKDAAPNPPKEDISGYALAIICKKGREIIDRISVQGIAETVFKCPECQVHFLRGLFVSCASITDPESQYHLEFLIKDTKKAALIFSVLRESFAQPTLINRKSGVGLVYKSSSVIEDILSVAGANRAYFTLVNGKIEREIRNNENRATNCETRNIAALVDAAGRQIAAIEKLKAEDKYDSLPQALKETAEMRLLYPSLPLSELASKFAPPLTKSGLNNRLKKILELAN